VLLLHKVRYVESVVKSRSLIIGVIEVLNIIRPVNAFSTLIEPAYAIANI
jgi:hypothetical protein